MYKLFSALVWLMILFVAIILAVVCFSCTATKQVVTAPARMEIHYDVDGDSVFIQYSKNGIDWKTDTVLTKQSGVIVREYQMFNRLKVVLGNEVVYSKVIRL